jgi:hypothetical protein
MGGNCADGVCCNSACNGSCEYCNGSTPGTCGYVSGTPKPGHPACTGTGACQGSCNNTKASCTLPGAETTCRQSSCGGTPPTATNQAVCDGNGSCPNLSTTPCSPCICGATSCLTSCSSSTQCASAAACMGGACQTCGSGQSVCGNGCYNLQSDPNHCGNCTNPCSVGTPLCVSGACVQCSTLSDCLSGYVACSASHTCVCRQKSSTNLLQNPGFDGSLSGWNPGPSASWSPSDAEGCPGSGSASYPSALTSGMTQCISTGVGPNQPYYFGLRFTGESICSTAYYSDTTCTNVVSGSTGITLQGNAGPTNWTAALSGSDVTPAGTHSLMVNCGPVVGAGSVDLIYVNTSTYSF